MSNVLFLNHKKQQCGIYQYGYRTARALERSTAYRFAYCEAESKDEFLAIARPLNPIAIFYNYHGSTMPWLDKSCLDAFPAAKHLGLHHESDRYVTFDYTVLVDSTAGDSNNSFSVPRPLFETVEGGPKGPVPVVGSFGFAADNKGFARVVRLVNDQFDEAVIRLHIPRSYYGDRDGQVSSRLFPLFHQEVKKANIKLEITSGFLSDEALLSFLAANSINAFLYEDSSGRGLSSVIDYALSVKVPLAITRSCMFRHIYDTTPSICIENRPLIDIMRSGSEPLQCYRNEWSPKRLVEKYETIVKATRWTSSSQ